MNKYAKLIRSLRCDGGETPEEGDGLGCANKKCKYRDVDGACDLVSMTLDAAAAITALQSENGSKDKEIVKLKLEKELMRQEWDTLHAALSRMEAERDVAVADIEQMAVSLPVCMACQFCAHGTEGMECDECDDCYNFVWRGAQGVE